MSAWPVRVLGPAYVALKSHTCEERGREKEGGRVTGRYRELEVVSYTGYTRLQVITVGYRWLRRVTLGYRWLRRVTLGYLNGAVC